MDNYNKTIINTLPEDEHNILLLLEKNKKCFHGNIVKELNISLTKGAAQTLPLLTKGFTQNIGTTSFDELKVTLVK